MTESYRNHPVVLVKSAFACAVLVFIVGVMDELDAGIRIFAAAILCLAWLVSVFVWRRTLVCFDDTEMRYVRNTVLSRTDKTIPYTRLASIGVSRTIFDRLFGTTVLNFNVNSSVNSAVPEVTLTLNRAIADRLRDDLNRKVFVKADTVEDEAGAESLVNVSNSDILVHAILSQSTAQLLGGAFFFLYSIYSVFNGSSGGLVASLVMLVASSVFPMISSVLSYCNYRLYRIGDTITVESGLLSTYRTSFKISKINTVRIRRPLIARLFGMATLEAEVVGLGTAGSGSETPLLCPLKPIGEVRDLMRTLVPEISFDAEPASQSRRAIPSLLLIAIFASAVSVLIAYAANGFIATSDAVDAALLRIVVLILGLGIPAVAFIWVAAAYRVRTFDAGDASFMVTTGSFDICEHYVLYDKIQFASVISGPIQRRMGLSELRVNILSSSGQLSIDTGMFEPKDLEHVMDEVLGRIADGRYDYRRYE